MTRRPLIVPAVILLLACVAILPACKKKTSDSGSGSGGDDSTPPPGVPAAGSSDYVLFAHLKAKDILDSAIFAEVKQAFDKAGGKADWDDLEAKFAKEIGGIKPTEIDAVSAWITDIPPKDEPRFVVIITASKPFQKGGNVFELGPNAKPDARGFYQLGREALLHYPTEKTLVVLHPALAQKYLDGYAKTRSGWPMTSELSRVTTRHTLYASLNMERVPSDLFRGQEAKEFESVSSARSVTFTADLKGKELSVAARARFPNAAAAGKARDTVNKFVDVAVKQVENVMSGKGPPELSGMMPAVKEAHRALKEAKVEVSGSDLTIAGSYRADFDVGAMVAEALKTIRGSADKMTGSNNLRQIGLAMHNYSSVYNGSLPVHAVGAKGAPLRTPKDKPLLSWRVAILPYIEQENLYKQFNLDEPWDSVKNKRLIAMMPKIYAPAKPGQPGYTHMQMVIGPNAMSPIGARMPASFPDGTSNTIAVVEAASPVIWTKPDDVMLTGKEMPNDLKKKFGGQSPGGFYVVMWDGSVRFVKATTSERTLGIALNPRDGMVLGSDW